VDDAGNTKSRRLSATTPTATIPATAMAVTDSVWRVRVVVGTGRG
jgi:hypothetical protein